MNKNDYENEIKKIIAEFSHLIENFSISAIYSEYEQCATITFIGDGENYNDRVWLAGILSNLIENGFLVIRIDITKMTSICEPLFELFIELNIVLKSRNGYLCVTRLKDENKIEFRGNYKRIFNIYNEDSAIRKRLPFFTEYGNLQYINNDIEISRIEDNWNIDIISLGLSGCGYSKNIIHYERK